MAGIACHGAMPKKENTGQATGGEKTDQEIGKTHQGSHSRINGRTLLWVMRPTEEIMMIDLPRGGAVRKRAAARSRNLRLIPC